MNYTGNINGIVDKKVSPRIIPSKDERYIGLAFFISSFSKDPHTQMGAVIVGENNKPLGYGYNGPPKAISDADINWERPDKYPYIRHAEVNAITFSDKHLLEGSTLYVTGKPCKDCILDIIAAGITSVIYYPYKTKDKESMMYKDKTAATDEIVAKVKNLTMIEFKGNLNWIKDQVKFWDHLNIF